MIKFSLPVLFLPLKEAANGQDVLSATILRLSSNNSRILSKNLTNLNSSISDFTSIRRSPTFLSSSYKNNKLLCIFIYVNKISLYYLHIFLNFNYFILPLFGFIQH